MEKTAGITRQMRTVTVFPVQKEMIPPRSFDIRDFKDGDRIQQIHWKLSSKAGHYMVKDRESPPGKSGTYFSGPVCRGCADGRSARTGHIFRIHGIDGAGSTAALYLV